MAKKDIEIGDHVKIRMDENNPRAGQYQDQEADVEGEIGSNPRVLKLAVGGGEDIIYVKEEEVRLI